MKKQKELDEYFISLEKEFRGLKARLLMRKVLIGLGMAVFILAGYMLCAQAILNSFSGFRFYY